MERWWNFLTLVLFVPLLLFLLLLLLAIHGSKDMEELHNPTTGPATPIHRQTHWKMPKNAAVPRYHHFSPLSESPVISPEIAPVPSPSQVASPLDRQRSHTSPSSGKGSTNSSTAPASGSFEGNPRDSLPQPFHALPPPSPNLECMSLTCPNPLTNSPPGFPCACVLPIRVALQLDVALYTFFPLVSQLSQDIASGLYLDQSQVRVMGANADNEEPEKTIMFINLVPFGERFDNTTIFFIFEKFRRKKLSVNASIFGDYDVIYVLYPGLPPSPRMAPGMIFGTDNNGRVINPLAVDVKEPNGKHHGGLKTVLVLSSTTVLILFLGATLFLFLKCRYYKHLAAPILQNSLTPTIKSIGSRLTTSDLQPLSESASLNVSIITHVGLAKTFNVSDIEKATNNFDVSRIIGEGGFGRVYEGNLGVGTRVAVKVLKRYDQHGSREFLAEVEMLSRLHHRNLVKLIGICAEDYIRCLVYELIPNGSVESHLHGAHSLSSPLDWNSRMKIALGAARCLAYLHEDSNPCVIHRDFKSSNVLLEHDFTPRVSDLGLARTALNGGNEHISTHVVGTFGYVAPEYAMTGHLLVKSDVYSYGVVLLELLTGRKPVDMSRPPGQENLVSFTRMLLTSKESLRTILDPSLDTKIPIDIIENVAAIASMCVETEVSKRPYMSEVVQALKLVCSESSEYIESNDNRREEPELFPIAFNNSIRFIEEASGSLTRYSSSGTLMNGWSHHFQPWVRASSADCVSEHGFAFECGRGMESGESWP